MVAELLPKGQPYSIATLDIAERCTTLNRVHYFNYVWLPTLNRIKYCFEEFSIKKVATDILKVPDLN